MSNNILKVDNVDKPKHYQHGFVGIVKVNTKDNVIKEYPVQENFVTPIGRQLDNNMGPGRLLSVGGDVWGLTHVRQAMTTVGRPTTSGNQAVLGNIISEMTLVLLSLGDDINSVDENTSTIYVHANDGSVRAAKVVGYANGNIQPASNGKEGYLDLSKPEYVMNKFYQVNRWVFDTDVAVGTIDAVAMMPASAIKSIGGSGISTWMCIDKGNVQDIDFTSRTTAFCPPGIAGFTGNNGVFLNYTHTGNSRHKLDLSTGDMLDLDGSESWFTFPANTMDWIIDGDYVYALVKSALSTSRMTVYVYNKATMREVYNFDINYDINSNYNQGRLYKSLIKASFLMKSGVLYITTVLYEVEGLAVDRYYTLTKGTKAYWSAKTGTAPAFYDELVTLPAFVKNDNQVAFGNFGDKYLMYVLEYIYDFTTVPSGYTDYSGLTCMAYVFSDLEDIAGSMEQNKIFYGISPYTLKYKTDTRGGFLKIGFEPHIGNPKIGYTPYDNIIGNKIIVNNSSGSYQEILNNSQGLWISDESEHGNCYSIRLLSEPVEKGPSDKLYVSYGYQR